ncbi:MAG: hypothetical protein P4M12_09395 [Gammaproteobacteria bacterium]|nr:hypothetical protein [Gammaproteobacteria bacterium]
MRSNTDEKRLTPSYPLRPNRYNAYGWNTNFQACYNDDDLALLKKIQTEYSSLQEAQYYEKFFGLVQEKKLYDMWVCTRPQLNLGLERHSFTLPAQETKDSRIHPLWHYADNKARQIANWQSERTRNQNHELLNDPVMIVFEELKNWYFSILAMKECKLEELELISKRQSYIKNLIHIIPHFGSDRLYLHEIQKSLIDAEKIIFNCIANKELPQFLVDTIITAKSLENTIGSYLHFLLINEEVTDNFSPEYLNGNTRNCNQSPLCKIYHELKTSTDVAAINSPAFNQFYELITISKNDETVKFELQLKKELANKITFATFVTQRDKDNYIDAIASLEALINVRQILEHFQTILPRIGTYGFALNYLTSVDSLSNNFIKLISKTKSLLKDLLVSADHGLNGMLSHTDKSYLKNNYFEKNLQALETKVAKGTTVSAQLDKYCNNAIDSMNKYQQAMKKLVHSVSTGEAAHEVENAMAELFTQINNQNIFLSGVLNASPLVISNAKSNTMTGNKSSNKISDCAFTKNKIGFFSPIESTAQTHFDVKIPTPLITHVKNFEPRQAQAHTFTPPSTLSTVNNGTLALGFILGSMAVKFLYRHSFFSRKKSVKKNKKQTDMRSSRH